jgi:drug/metabolite transporter (DMT)-like permease
MPRQDLLRLLLCSALGVIFNQLLYVKGLSLTTVINVTLLSTAIPVFTLIVSVVLGYDDLSLRRTLGILLAAGGVIYLVDPLRADFSSHTTIGNLLVIANSFSYAAYIAISKDLLKRYGALNVITWVFVIAAIVNVPVGLLTTHQRSLTGIPATAWLAITYTILVPTVSAYYLNAWALVRVSPGTVSAYIYLQPLIAFGLAPMVLGERWNPRALGASALIFVGVAIVTRYGRSHAVKEVRKHPDALAH